MSPARISRFVQPTVMARVAWVVGLLVVLACVAAVYAPTVDDYFGGDDFMVLGPVRALGPWELIWKSFLFRDEIPYWRPLVSPIYALEVHVFGLRPWPYHVVAIALHLVNVALVAVVARVLTGRRGVALGAALLFGIHPAKTTTVPMISSTVELFGMAWYLLAVLCCLRFVRGDGRRWYWLGLLAFALGLLSKESVASAAAVISLGFLLLSSLPRLRGGRRRRVEAVRLLLLVLPFWSLVIPYTVMTYLENRADPTGIARAMYFVGPHFGQNLWWFLARLAAPLEIGQGPTVSSYGHAGAAILLVAGLLTLRHGSNAARLLVLWTVIALTPLAFWRPEYLVGRFTYMAAAPFAVLLSLAGAWLVDRLPATLPRLARPVATGALVAGALACVPLTMEQNLQRTREGEAYRLLVSTLRERYPALDDEANVVLVDGLWTGPFHAVFLNHVADTLYGPGRVRIVNATGEQAAHVRPREVRRTIRLQYEQGELRAAAGE